MADSNAKVTPNGYMRTADLLGALSLGADLAVGLSEEHAARACYIGVQIAQEMELLPEETADLYYAELLMDSGCTAWTSPLASYIQGDEITARKDLYVQSIGNQSKASLGAFVWLLKYMAPGAPLHVRGAHILEFILHGDERVKEAMVNTSQVAHRFSSRLGMSKAVQDAMEDIFERWDGQGPNGSKGTSISLIARIAYMTAFLEIFHQIKGREGAMDLAKDRRGKAFDPSLVDAFLAVAKKEDFWEVLERNQVWDSLLTAEPDSQYRYTSLEKLPEVALSFADFADMKSKYTLGQSRRVAEISLAIAHQMGLPEEEVSNIHIAGLMHNLGLVTVPSFVLEKPPEKLTNAEMEQIRLHPYHGQRILSNVPELETVSELVGAHHEQMDGMGYHRGLRGSQIPLGARIIAVADRYDELCHEMPGHTEMDSGAALDLMAQEVDAALCRDSFDGLVHVLEGQDHPQRQRTARRQWPMGLTDREVEVLRLIAKGMSRAQVADALTVSESTVRTHLEHIYNKAGVTSRAAATMFAMEHALV